MTEYLREDPSNPQNDYNHWKECHEALDNHLSSRYLDIHSLEDLEILVQELLETVGTYEFTGAKVYIQRLIQRTKNSSLPFEDAFSNAIDEMDEKIEHKIMERKGVAKRGITEKVEIESIPPFEIHKELWYDEVYFCGKHIIFDENDLDTKHANLNAVKCRKLLIALVRANDHRVTQDEAASKLTCSLHTVENTVSQLRAVLGAFNRSTGFQLEIPRKTSGTDAERYGHYELKYKGPNQA